MAPVIIEKKPFKDLKKKMKKLKKTPKENNSGGENSAVGQESLQQFGKKKIKTKKKDNTPIVQPKEISSEEESSEEQTPVAAPSLKKVKKTLLDLQEENSEEEINSEEDSNSEEDEEEEQMSEKQQLIQAFVKKDKTNEDPDPTIIRKVLTAPPTLSIQDKLKAVANGEALPEEEEITKSFKDLGVVDVLCEAVERLKWNKPTKIQAEALPLAFEGKDVIGLAETGSGKTGAFALPILQALLDKPQRFFALVLTPTRELAYQISEQFSALGASIGIKCATIVGGIDMYDQALILAKKPHVIVATPGRLVDHLENTKGFSLRTLKYLVLDEADRILNMDFEQELDNILRVIPRERSTYMFSATMTKKVEKLKRACLRNPCRVETNSKYKTVENLKQSYLFIPVKFKETYLVHILNELAGNSFIVFSYTCHNCQRLALMLRNLGLKAIPLNGQMTQEKRLGALNKFKAQEASILIATDVASRGLDIPHVDCVINYDIPSHTKDYIHRVGRTARAGRAGRAVTFVSQYEVELYKRIEELLGRQLPLYPTHEEEVMAIQERVAEAMRFAKIQLKDREEESKYAKRKRMRGENDDTEEASGMRKKFRKNKLKK